MKTAKTPVAIGLSSILCVFVVLLLTGFAVLSYASANADYKLTQKTILATKEFYAADAEAERALFALETLLDATGSPEAALTAWNQSYTATREKEGIAIIFELPVNETKLLEIKALAKEGSLVVLSRSVHPEE